MSDCSNEYFETQDEDAAEPEDEQAGEDADFQVDIDVGELAKVKAMIVEEFARGRLNRAKAEGLLNRTCELERRKEQDYEDLAATHFPDDFDAHLASRALYEKYIKAQRAIEFAALGIDLGGLASDYDHLLKNLSNPSWDKERARHAEMWRSLSPEQQEEFRQRVLAKGELSVDELNNLIKEYWE